MKQALLLGGSKVNLDQAIWGTAALCSAEGTSCGWFCVSKDLWSQQIIHFHTGKFLVDAFVEVTLERWKDSLGNSTEHCEGIGLFGGR